MQKVRVEEAVGMVLAHDLTKIVPGVFKGAAFKKGYIIKADDVEELKNMGKNHVFVVSLTEEQIHENDAAHRIATRAAARGTSVADPSEGKSNIKSTVRGLLKINREALTAANRMDQLALVSLHNNTVVDAGKVVAAAKIIPLVIERETVDQALEICERMAPVVEVKPFLPLKVGIVVTGSEVYSGRIEDKFGPVLGEKIGLYGGQLVGIEYAPDDMEFIIGRIQEMLSQGVEAILISGGMAVDADDVTPQAIRQVATEIVAYGLPVLPGSMGMLAYHGSVAMMGVPACAMFFKTTILDLVLPRILVGDRIRREELAELAHGGICLQCEDCRFPACSFGK